MQGDAVAVPGTEGHPPILVDGDGIGAEPQGRGNLGGGFAGNPGAGNRLVPVADEFVERPVHHDRAVADENQAVREIIRLAQVVRGEHDRPAAPGFRVHGAPEFAPGGGVHAGGRFVEDEQLRIRQQRQPEPQPLHLTAGAGADLPAHEIPDVGPPDHLFDGQRFPVAHGEHPQRLLDSQVLQQPSRLEHRADGTPPGRRGGRPPEHLDGARVRRREAEHHVQQRRLAGAVRAEQRDDFADGDRQGDIVDRGDGAEGFGHARDRQRRPGWFRWAAVGFPVRIHGLIITPGQTFRKCNAAGSRHDECHGHRVAPRCPATPTAPSPRHPIRGRV